MDKDNASNAEVSNKNFIAFIAIGLGVASVITSLCYVAYVSAVLAILAIVISILFLIKKLGIKWFGIGALLFGLIGAILGFPLTIQHMAAQFGWGEEKAAVDEDKDNTPDQAALEEAYEKKKACIEAAGIDPETNYDDLAEEQKDAYDACI